MINLLIESWDLHTNVTFDKIVLNNKSQVRFGIFFLAFRDVDWHHLVFNNDDYRKNGHYCIGFLGVLCLRKCCCFLKKIQNSAKTSFSRPD
jgi:hypothetical protein